jgi:hypothetical protein
VTGPLLPELQRYQVKTFGPHSLVPDWKESAAEYGRNFVTDRVFYALRHPTGYRPGVKWFAGEPAKFVNGMVYALDPSAIWLSAKLASWREIVETAAHETVHTYEGYSSTAKEHYYEHELPTLIGRLAAAHWACEREVYVKWGPMSDNWLPEGESALPYRAERAVVLNFEAGDHCTLVNVGQLDCPRWERRAI